MLIHILTRSNHRFQWCPELNSELFPCTPTIVLAATEVFGPVLNESPKVLARKLNIVPRLDTRRCVLRQIILDTNKSKWAGVAGRFAALLLRRFTGHVQPGWNVGT